MVLVMVQSQEAKTNVLKHDPKISFTNKEIEDFRQSNFHL